jgi:hypothetical protein
MDHQWRKIDERIAKLVEIRAKLSPERQAEFDREVEQILNEAVAAAKQRKLTALQRSRLRVIKGAKLKD